jgi:sigma-B regulation protein RsbU (phosphoserine phosphatase)
MHVLLHTRPGQAIVVGLAVKLLVSLVRVTMGSAPPLVGVLDTLASIAIAVGGSFFLARALSNARRTLLWRVRRKLIISYIFMGFVPAILLAAFALLGGLLLFSNFSSYLVQTRLKTMLDRSGGIAATTAQELQRPAGQDVATILQRRQESIEREFQDASLAVVQLDRPCAQAAPDQPSSSGPLRQVATAGLWAHMDPPVEIPSWITCDGFTGFLGYRSDDGELHLLMRAVRFTSPRLPALGVVVDVPLNAVVRQQVLVDTGVEVTNVQLVPEGSAAGLLSGRAERATAQPSSPSSLPLTSWSFVQVRDWSTGASGSLLARTRLSVAEIYSRLSAAQGLIGERSVGAGLLLFLIIIGVLFLIIQAVALVAGLALARSITGSVHELFEGTERVRRGDFTHKIPITARDQLGELAESFNSMTASIEDLLRQAAEKKRLEEELRIAHEIQMSLLPQGPLGIPGLSVTALCVPAREVGGDYYDFLRIDDHRLGVLIADVSGKGTSAALYMAELKGLMLSLSRVYTSPRELLITANRIIAEHLDARSFITMTYAVIDLRRATMTYARAGHTPLIALQRHASGAGGTRSNVTAQVQVLAPDGMVLGLNIDDGRTFERILEERTVSLSDGDLYLFFTDGITEAMNAGDDCFGEQRLGRIVEQHADLPSEELRERVLREIEAFVGDAPQHDDMTMILLRIGDLGASLAPAPPVEVAGSRPS